jgi:hypothetical protein
MEQYIYEPKLNLDYKYLKNLVLGEKDKVLSKKTANSVEHHRFVEDDEYMTSINNRFPFLSNKYNVYKTHDMRSIPLHIDSLRKAAFNIPILNTENSSTIFYSPDEELDFEYVPSRVYNIIRSKVTESFRFTLTKPTLINNSVPHMVINRSPLTRVIISWSVKLEHSFDDAKVMFQKIIREEEYNILPNCH